MGRRLQVRPRRQQEVRRRQPVRRRGQDPGPERDGLRGPQRQDGLREVHGSRRGQAGQVPGGARPPPGRRCATAAGHRGGAGPQGHPRSARGPAALRLPPGHAQRPQGRPQGDAADRPLSGRGQGQGPGRGHRHAALRRALPGVVEGRGERRPCRPRPEEGGRGRAGRGRCGRADDRALPGGGRIREPLHGGPGRQAHGHHQPGPDHRRGLPGHGPGRRADPGAADHAGRRPLGAAPAAGAGQGRPRAARLRPGCAPGRLAPEGRGRLPDRRDQRDARRPGPGRDRPACQRAAPGQGPGDRPRGQLGGGPSHAARPAVGGDAPHPGDGPRPSGLLHRGGHDPGAPRGPRDAGPGPREVRRRAEAAARRVPDRADRRI